MRLLGLPAVPEFCKATIGDIRAGDSQALLQVAGTIGEHPYAVQSVYVWATACACVMCSCRIYSLQNASSPFPCPHHTQSAAEASGCWRCRSSFSARSE